MRKIRSKYLLLLLSLAIIPNIIITISSYGVSRSALQDRINELGASSVSQMAGRIGRRMETIEIYIEVVWKNPLFMEALREIAESDYDTDYHRNAVRLTDLLTQLLVRETAVESMVFRSADDVYYVFRYGSDLQAYFGRAQWYDRIATNKGRITWLGEVENPNPQAQERTSFAVGKQLRDVSYLNDYEIVGTFIVFLQSSFFESLLTSDDGSVNVIQTQDGIVGQSKTFLVDGATLPDDSRYEAKNGTVYTVLTAPIGELGWTAAKLIPDEIFTRDLRTLTTVSVLILVIVVIVGVFIASVASERLARPIRSLAQAMEAVGKGDFAVSVDTARRDELGQVFRGFNDMVAEIDSLFKSSIRAERQKKHAELTALQFQMNPHFLFNTLYAIRLHALKGSPGQETGALLLKLSRLMRRTINRKGEFVTVEDEIRVLEDYLDLIRFRQGERVGVVVDIAQTCERYVVPNLFLQPLVENAIQHGLHDRINGQGNAQLAVTGHHHNGTLSFSVWDNGSGMAPDRIEQVFASETELSCGEHIGLRNVQDRIRLLFGNEYGLSIESVVGEYTNIVVTLPAREYKDSA